MTEVTTDFVARTAAGVIIATFAERYQAMAWADVTGWQFPGFSIAKRERVVTERMMVLRRDRSHLREVA